MEDIKKIQEFFSKPLNENVHVEAFKLGKALKGMGYDVKVKAVDDFGKNVFEIYFNNPADADDDSIFYDVKKLGYDNVRVFANPQESLTENGDPIIVKYFKPGDEYFQILVKYEKPVGFTTALGSRTALGQQNDQNEAAAQKRVKTIVNNLKANFDLDEIFVEKGQVAGRYYINAFSDDFVDIDADYLKNNLSEASKDEETTFHKKLDTLVHDTFGKRKGEMEEYNTGIYYKDEKTQDKTKEASKSALEKVKDMIQKVLKEEEGYSKFLKTDDNPEGKTKGLDTATMNKILMNVIKDLDEAKPGLWANIRAKKERGEKPSHGNSKAHKDAVKAGKRINKEK